MGVIFYFLLLDIFKLPIPIQSTFFVLLLTQILYCFGDICDRFLIVLCRLGLRGGNCYVNIWRWMGWSFETGKLSCIVVFCIHLHFLYETSCCTVAGGLCVIMHTTCQKGSKYNVLVTLPVIAWFLWFFHWPSLLCIGSGAVMHPDLCL